MRQKRIQVTTQTGNEDAILPHIRVVILGSADHAHHKTKRVHSLYVILRMNS